MQGPGRLFCALAVAAGLTAAPALAETPALSVQQTRVLGYAILEDGDPQGALTLADALLRRDPRDVPALMLKARAAQELGQPRAARAAGRLAWRHATTDSERFGSAYFMAQSFAAEGRPGWGQFWLRRAAQAAPTPEDEAAVAADYRWMRSRNPLVWSLSLSVTPSTNVNNGSIEDAFSLPGLPFELEIGGAQKALSGWEARASADLAWRLPPTATTMTSLHLRLDQSRVFLSDEARETAPEARGSDYDSASVEVGATRRWRPEGSATTYAFGGWLGHDWFGGEDLANTLRLTARADRALSARTAGMVLATAERQVRLDDDTRSATILGASLGLQHRLAGHDVVTLTFGLRKTETDSAGLRNTALLAGLGWQKAEPVGGVGLEAWLNLEARDYPDSPYDPVDGRQDYRASLGVTLSFEEIRYMGFSPTLELRASRNRSDAGLYDSREFGMQFGFRSAF